MLRGIIEQAERDGIIVIHRPLHSSTGGGACCWIDGRPVVYIDPRLHPYERAEVLAHELAHARRGHRPRIEGPQWRPVAMREEAACDRDAATMLLDLGWLADVMALAEADGITITAHDVAAEAEVTVAVAERAMRMVDQDGRLRVA